MYGIFLQQAKIIHSVKIFPAFMKLTSQKLACDQAIQVQILTACPYFPSTDLLVALSH
jgi:hypothetical protein